MSKRKNRLLREQGAEYALRRSSGYTAGQDAAGVPFMASDFCRQCCDYHVPSERCAFQGQQS